MKNWHMNVILTAAAMGLPLPQQEIHQVIDALR